MRLTMLNVKNVDALFEVIDKCEGKVELVGEDICLNLKSKLAQYFSLAKLFSDGNKIPELELVTYNENDSKRLIDFMIEGKGL